MEAWELLPILRNIDDIVQGYSVTQPDMALLEGLLQAGMRTYNVLTDEETLGEMTPEDWYGLAKDLAGAWATSWVFRRKISGVIWKALGGCSRT